MQGQNVLPGGDSTIGLFGYARLDEMGGLVESSVRFKDPAGSFQAELSESSVLLRPTEAAALRAKIEGRAEVQAGVTDEAGRKTTKIAVIETEVGTGEDVIKQIESQLELLKPETIPSLRLEARGELSLAALTSLVTTIKTELKKALDLRAEVRIQLPDGSPLPASILEKAKRVLMGYQNVQFKVSAGKGEETRIQQDDKPNEG